MPKFSYADEGNINPVKGGGIDTPMMTGALVIGALVALILIRRGFRGVNVLGASANIG
jgi:hypothetical protein